MSASEMDQVIEILQMTNDGKDLAPVHLELIQHFTRNLYGVTEAMEVALVELHAQVVVGNYTRNGLYLHGVEHLIKDHQGYVYWKGVEVEHYSFQDPTPERLAALELARLCLSLESRKIPVSGRAILDRRFHEAPEGTPWLRLLQHLYSAFFEDGELVWLLLSTKEGKGIAIRKDGSSTVRRVFEDSLGMGCYNGYHAFHQEGYETMAERTGTYSGLIHEVELKGFTPDDIQQALA